MLFQPSPRPPYQAEASVLAFARRAKCQPDLCCFLGGAETSHGIKHFAATRLERFDVQMAISAFQGDTEANTQLKDVKEQ